MLLESPKITIAKTQNETFNFLSNVENFEKLMPESIEKFEVLTSDSFLFSLKGMPEIVLKKKEELPHQRIVFGAAGGKLDFSLIGTIKGSGQESSEVFLTFQGDFNPMMAMMIKNPIKKFIETLVSNLPNAL